MAQTQCPHCKVRLRVPDPVVEQGKKLRCPRCSQVFPAQASTPGRVPEPPSASADVGSEDPGAYFSSAAAAGAVRHRSRPKKEPASPVLITACILLLVAVVAGGGVAIYIIGNADTSRKEEQARQEQEDIQTSDLGQVDPPGSQNRRRSSSTRDQATPPTARMNLEKDPKLLLESLEMHRSIYGGALGFVSGALSSQYAEPIREATVTIYFFNEAGEYRTNPALTVRYIPAHGTVRISQEFSGIDPAGIARLDYEILQVKSAGDIACFEVDDLNYDRQEKKISGWVENVTRKDMVNPALMVEFIGRNKKVQASMLLTDLGPDIPRRLTSGARRYVEAQVELEDFVVPESISYRLCEMPEAANP